MFRRLRKGIPFSLAIGIILVLAVLVGGFTIWQFLDIQEDLPLAIEIPVKEEPKKVEITQELTDKIINNILPVNYDRESVVSFIQDLNSDELEELIISATSIVSPQELPHQAYIIVVTPLDKTGNFKKVAEFYFGEEERIVFRSTPRVNTLINNSGILDIDGDGEKEIILGLGTGGASNEAYGIFQIDWILGEINWLKIKAEDGTVENTYFLTGGSVMHQESFYFEDIDHDGLLEMIEKSGRYLGGSGEPEDWEKEESWEWQTWVYKWDGLIFSYNKELSVLVAERANWKTYRNEDYGFEIKYPKDVTLSIGEEANKGFTENLADGETLVKINLSDSEYKDTNFREAFLSVNVNENEEALSKCFINQLFASQEGRFVEKEIDGITFYRDTWSEGATGHRYFITIYRTIHQEKCYELLQAVHSVNPGMFLPKVVPEFNQEKVSQTLNQILSTFRFLE